MILKPVRTNEQRRLVSPNDPAIDVESSGQSLIDYRDRKHLEPSRLKFHPDRFPVWFVIRGATESEKSRCSLIGYGGSRPESPGDAVLAFNVYLEAMARYAVVGVEVQDEDHTEPQRVPLGSRVEWHGLPAWSRDAMDRLDKDAVWWIGNVIHELSTLDPTSAGSAG